MNPLPPTDCRSQFHKLSVENQAELIAQLAKVGCTKLAGELNKKGAKTSRSALNRFRHWWNLRQKFNEDHANTEVFVAKLALEHPELTEAELTAFGNRHFNLRAIKTENNQEWVNTQKLRIADAHLALDHRRVSLLEKQAEQEQAPPVPQLSLEEQERRMKAIFGIVS